uniref:Uncharacterized protein n=1 Tax=Globodera rostochiensis TaxID=31243 RepID=A0A914GUD5_GLORO
MEVYVGAYCLNKWCSQCREQLQSRNKQLERREAQQHGRRNCKCQQEVLQSKIKQLSGEKHNSMEVVLISDRSDAFSTLEGIANANKKYYKARSSRRNCKCQQEVLQSKIKQLEREKDNSMAVALKVTDPMRFRLWNELQMPTRMTDPMRFRLWKELQMPTRSTTKQDQAVERREAQQHGRRNCKCQQEVLQSKIKQLEREKDNSMAVALISD